MSYGNRRFSNPSPYGGSSYGRGHYNPPERWGPPGQHSSYGGDRGRPSMPYGGSQYQNRRSFTPHSHPGNDDWDTPVSPRQWNPPAQSRGGRGMSYSSSRFDRSDFNYDDAPEHRPSSSFTQDNYGPGRGYQNRSGTNFDLPARFHEDDNLEQSDEEPDGMEGEGGPNEIGYFGGETGEMDGGMQGGEDDIDLYYDPKLLDLDLENKENLSVYIDHLILTCHSGLETHIKLYNQLVQKFVLQGGLSETETKAYLHNRREINRLCGILKRDITKCPQQFLKLEPYLLDAKAIMDLKYQPRPAPDPTGARPCFDDSGLPDVNMLPHLVNDDKKFARRGARRGRFARCKNNFEYMEARLKILDNFYMTKNVFFKLMENPELKIEVLGDLAKAHQIAKSRADGTPGSNRMASSLKHTLVNLAVKGKFDVDAPDAATKGKNEMKKQIEKCFEAIERKEMIRNVRAIKNVEKDKIRKAKQQIKKQKKLEKQRNKAMKKKQQNY